MARGTALLTVWTQKATAHRMAGETEFYGDVRDVVIRDLPVCVVLTE